MISKYGLTSQNICEIIKQCGESGVTQLSFEGLTLSFKARGNEQAHNFQSSGPMTAISPEDYSELIQQDELREKEEEISEMKLNDPLKYEELLAHGEFE